MRDAVALERGVEPADLGELAREGLLAVSGPPELGGLDAAGQRAVHERLAGASPDLWFTWFQHGPVVKALTDTDNTGLRDRHLADLCTGRTQGGVGWSNLRTARPSVMATRIDGGWQLDGSQPWCTAWPMLDLVLVGGLAGDQVVFGVVELPDAGLVSTGELSLAAMSGTRTHAVRYDALILADDRVTSVQPYAQWQADDRAGNTNTQPATFGVALAALDLLEPDPAAALLRQQVLEVRTEAYRLRDEVAREERLAERLALRAQALELGLRCTTALLAARGGRGMGTDDPAQRLLRAAAFQLVHSQDGAVRAATLDELTRLACWPCPTALP